MIDNINHQLSKSNIDSTYDEVKRLEMQNLIIKTIRKMVNIIRSEN